MKKVSLIFVAAMLLTVGGLFANQGMIGENPSKTLSEQIKKILSDDNSFQVTEGSEVFAVIYFTVNSEDEIVVLTVASNDGNLGDYIKDKLNYTEVDGAHENGITYKIPVHMKA